MRYDILLSSSSHLFFPLTCIAAFDKAVSPPTMRVSSLSPELLVLGASLLKNLQLFGFGNVTVLLFSETPAFFFEVLALVVPEPTRLHGTWTSVR